MQLADIESFIETLTGRAITGGDVDHEGMHLFLDDGRVLVIVGIVYAGILEKETMQ